ncbi:MAG TPA: ParB/RepB/Spo0J family partition protein [Candidatus Omnitrophota bacterium]|nr:ParB/RepB/Spo0J family partition protein [Candidatus Omnitrophota bacterium]
MACHDPQRIAVARVAGSMPYCFRHCLSDDALKNSIKRSGVLLPVIITGNKRPLLITGHRRFVAARLFKIKEMPAIVAAKLKPRDAFLLNLVSNWKQGCSDPDRAKALGMAARKFGFKEKEILSTIMPLLGLPQEKSLWELYLKIDRFPHSLKDLMEAGQLPLRAAASLVKFSPKDQDYLATKVSSKVKLTSSQFLQAGEWLSDLMRRTGKSLQALLEKNQVLKGLGVSGMDGRAKADRFFARVKALRFPGYSRYLEKFEEKRAAMLRDAKEIRLEPVQGFEEPGFELHARVKDPEALDRLLQKLSRERSALNSLFEIVL